jgi:protein SCO1
MGAMTMQFRVKDPKDFAGLQPGDLISFHLMVASHDGWIQNITVLSNSQPAAAAPLPAITSPELQVTRAVAPLAVGDRLPDYHFTNELGQPVTFGHSQGQVIAFTFFFTRCPFPTACPLLSDNFAGVQETLPATPGAPANWHLFSVSFDPANDTPAVLQDYARRYHYDPAHWSFLTGSLADITELAGQFGQEFQNDGHTVSHNFRTVVIDADGRVRCIFPGNIWTSNDLVREMLKASKKL